MVSWLIGGAGMSVEFRWQVENDEEEIKRALIEYGPLVICFPVYQDFMYYKRGVYRHRWGPRVGGHLVALVGYDDSKQCWIVKNSWGTEWGNHGWFKMGYDPDMFIDGCYGGTGILYVDGVYGNFMPDVPEIYIEKPNRGLQEEALGLRGDEPELQGLAPQAYRNWKIGGCHRLMADIHDSVSDPIGDAGEDHALEPPVREKDQLLIFPRSVGQHVAEYTAQQIGFHPAEPAGKKMIRLLQGSRCPALGALMFNE